MAIIDIDYSGLPKDLSLGFLFYTEATMDAADVQEVYLNGVTGSQWNPPYEGVWQGQLSCMAVCVNAGDGTQTVGATHSREVNITFEYVGGVGSIAFQHQYFNFKDTNMNGTWSFSVNTGQGISIKWEAPSGALNTQFKLRCVASVNEVKI